MNKLEVFNSKMSSNSSNYSDLRAGWTVKVFQKIKEGDKSRVQAFEGIIISRKHGNEPGATITVRKVSEGIGVEKTFPLRLPTITKIDVIRRTEVRKSKLYYLRDKSARETRKKMKTRQESLDSNKDVVST